MGKCNNDSFSATIGSKLNYIYIYEYSCCNKSIAKISQPR